jgi:hypothetical protein
MIVTFSNASGYKVQLRPLRIDPDGTVLVGVPLYVDPPSGKIMPGDVQITVSQALPNSSQNVTSSPAAFTIQDLPTISGAPTGTITRKYLAFSALLAQRHLTALQYVQNVLNIDTQNAREMEVQLIRATIQARTQVDAIMKDPKQIIPLGTTQQGIAVNFAIDSLELMDRTIAVWLSQLSLFANSTTTKQQRASLAPDGVSFTEFLDTLSSGVDLGLNANKFVLNTDPKLDLTDRSLAFVQTE